MEKVSMSLDRLPPYGVCRVERVGNENLRRRLCGLGISEGAQLVWLFCAASGDPVAYLVRGTVVAIRRKDAEGIIVGSENKWV